MNKEVALPDGATNISLKVEEYWFVGSPATIFTEHFDSPVTKCYSIYGTTLNPRYDEISCCPLDPPRVHPPAPGDPGEGGGQ